MNVPELRFPEFEGEWEEKKLGDTSNINPKSDKLPDEFIYIDLESVESGILKKENHIIKEEAPSRAQRVLKDDDILYQTVRPYQKNNLYFKSKNLFKYVASTGYAQIRCKEDSQFIYQYLHTDKFVNKVLSRCTGTSYPAVSSKDLELIKINIPTLQEQQKTASFLRNVDEKIEKLEKKEELWQTYKKGMMQQLFSQKLRFKDDDGNDYHDWEEKQVLEIADTIDGDRSSRYPNETDLVNEGIIFLSTSNIINNKMDFQEKRFITTIKFNELKKGKLNQNDLIVTLRGSIGNIALFNSDIYNTGFINAQMMIIRLNYNSHNYFYYWYLSPHNQKELLKISSGSAQPQLTKSDINNLKIKLPSLPEQTKIANFLSSIDTKIENIQKELMINKQFKKGLLQQMFPSDRKSEDIKTKNLSKLHDKQEEQAVLL